MIRDAVPVLRVVPRLNSPQIHRDMAGSDCPTMHSPVARPSRSHGVAMGEGLQRSKDRSLTARSRSAVLDPQPTFRMLQSGN